MILLIFPAILLFSAIFASIMVNYKSYKVYSIEYKKLNKSNYSIYANTIWDYPGKGSQYFLGRGDVRVGFNDYLFNNHVTYFDPFALYWYLKYKKWFKINFPEAFN